MKLKYFLQLIILFLSMVIFNNTANAAAITETQAIEWANQKGREIIALLTAPESEEKYHQLDNILFNDVDLDHAARYVVGKYWKNMSEAQRQKYVPLFKRYIAAVYKSYPLELQQGDVDFSVEKAIQNTKNTEIHCKIFIKVLENSVDENSKGGINAVFVLSIENNQIKVQDLKIAESSLLQAYRERFYKLIHEDSDDEIDWFLDELEEIVQDNENKNAEKSFES